MDCRGFSWSCAVNLLSVSKLGGTCQERSFGKSLGFRFPALLQTGVWDTNLQMSICGSV